MESSVPEQKSPDPADASPISHHRQSSMPTKSTSGGQRSQSHSQSPALSKKRKRDGSEALQGASEPSATNSQPATSSSTATAPIDQPALSAQHVSVSAVGRSPSTASINPGNGQTHVNHTARNGAGSDINAVEHQDEDSAVVWRSKEKLAACLACDLCHEVLKDPVTAPECMHSFCRDCIDQHVLYGGTKNICPVCTATGLQTVFGPQPFQHGKLQFDPMLADMIRKLFPRADVEKSIQERQDAEAKFRASLLPVKKLKTAPVKTPPPASGHATASSPAAPAGAGRAHTTSLQPASVSPPQSQAVPAASARVGVFLQLLDSDVQLALPYLWVQQAMSLKSLSLYVSGQLRLDSSVYHICLGCEGALLQPALTVQSLWRQWLRTHQLQDLIILQVRIQQSTDPPPEPTK